MQNEEQKDEQPTEAGMAQNPMLGEVCRFIDIPQQGFFIYEGVKLCRFGPYGMGVDANGTVAKRLGPDVLVNRANFT